MKSVTLFILFPLLLPNFAHSDVLDVGGPNPDATQIADAVALASEGDVIRVYPGVYDGFTVDGKSLTFVRAGNQGTIFSWYVGIKNLGPDQSVELHGFGGPVNKPPLEIFDNLGSVRLYGSHIDGYCRIRDSADVVFVDSSFVGRDGFPSAIGQGQGGPGMPGLEVIDSRLALYRCAVTGGDGGWAMKQVNGCLFGAHYGGPGGPAVRLEGSGELFLSLSILTAGLGEEHDNTCVFGTAPDGSGMETELGASFEVRSLESVMSPLLVPLEPGTTLSTIPGIARRMTGPASIYDDESLLLRVFGAPGDHVGVFVSNGHAHDTTPIHGPLLVSVPQGPDFPMWLYLGRIGPTGSIDYSMPVRNLPAFAHVKLHLVGVTSSPSGRFYTNGLNPILLDQAWSQ